jgi:hypothetical protein
VNSRLVPMRLLRNDLKHEAARHNPEATNVMVEHGLQGNDYSTLPQLQKLQQQMLPTQHRTRGCSRMYRRRCCALVPCKLTLIGTKGLTELQHRSLHLSKQPLKQERGCRSARLFAGRPSRLNVCEEALTVTPHFNSTSTLIYHWAHFVQQSC